MEDQEIQALTRRIKLLEDQLEDVKYWRDPDNTYQRIENLIEWVDEINSKVEKVMRRTSIFINDSFIGIYSDKDIQTAYLKSGMSLSEFITELKKVGLYVDTSQASNYANAKVADLYIRHKIIQVCKDIIAEKEYQKYELKV